VEGEGTSGIQVFLLVSSAKQMLDVLVTTAMGLRVMLLVLCAQSTNHLLLDCVFTGEVCTRLLQPLGWHHVILKIDSSGQLMGGRVEEDWKAAQALVGLTSVANHSVGVVRA
jgi:hypothetical protein